MKNINFDPPQQMNSHSAFPQYGLEAKDEQLCRKLDQIKTLLNSLLKIPARYEVFICRHADPEINSIFSMLDLSGYSRTAFLDTGSRSLAAINGARNYLEPEISGSSGASLYSYVPKCNWIPFGISFLHFTSTNELQGNTMRNVPEISVPLICDKSADLFSSVTNFAKFELVYATGGCGIIPENITLVFCKANTAFRPLEQFISGDYSAKMRLNLLTGNFTDLFVLHHKLLQFESDGGIETEKKRLAGIAGMLYKEIRRNTKLQALVNPADCSDISVRFSLKKQQEYYSFMKSMDSEHSNVLKLSPHGDFLVNVSNLTQDAAFSMVSVMQDFERSVKKVQTSKTS